MAADKAMDVFLKEQRMKSDIWKQNYIPLQVKQEKPPSPQAGPSKGGRRSPSPNEAKARDTSKHFYISWY
jgi:hypothetical protein